MMSHVDPESTPATESGRLADWPKVLEWIEKQGQDSLKARYATAELISKEAQTTLTVLLAGVGGTAAYAAKLFEPAPLAPVTIAAAATCAYLILLCVLLVSACMLFKSYPALYQDPRNLLQPQHSLDDLREAELHNLQDRISEAKSINAARARRLNAIRFAAAVSPLVFLIAALAAPKPPTSPPEKFSLVCKVELAASGPSSTVRCEGSK